MKIGVCTDISRAELIKGLGYDYAEFNLSSLYSMSDEDFSDLKKKLSELDFYAESFNCFCPGSVRLTVGMDRDTVAAYSKKVFSRAAQIGGRIAVIGSGGSRSIPDGYDIEKAKDEFKTALDTASDIASLYRMKVAIEPLRRAETNFINTLADAAEICSALGKESVGCIVDLFHFDQNKEDIKDIEIYKEHILHTHLARRNNDRRIPVACDRECVEDFYNALKNINFDGRMSLEGSFYPDFETSCKEAMELFKALNMK